MRVGVDSKVVEVVEESIDGCLDHGALACAAHGAGDLLDWEGRPDLVPGLAPPALALRPLDCQGVGVHLRGSKVLALARQDEDLSSSDVVLGHVQLVFVLAKRLIRAPTDALLLGTTGPDEAADAP